MIGKIISIVFLYKKAEFLHRLKYVVSYLSSVAAVAATLWSGYWRLVCRRPEDWLPDMEGRTDHQTREGVIR